MPGTTVIPDISGMPGTEGATMPPGGAAVTTGGSLPAVPTACLPETACPTGPCGFLLWGDALWLRPRRSDPVIFESSTVGITRTDVGTDYVTDHFFAYRVGVGYLTQGGWLVTGSYMKFDDVVATQVATQQGGTTVQFVGPGQLSAATGQLVGSSWHLRYENVDLMAGAVISPADYLDLTIGLGTKIAWIDQSYTNVRDNTSTPGGDLLREDLSLDLRGAGPRLGSEARLYLAPWLAVYGRGYTSLLLARREDESVLNQFAAGGTLASTRVIRYHREEVVPVIELATGAEACLCDGRLILGGGYECNYWFNLGTSTVENAGVPAFSRQNDISLDGFYIRATILW
jgi:hypothetical protein